MSETPRCPVLPHPLPADEARRFLLFALRRMAGHDIRDAWAATMFFSRFGIRFRKPLVLMRAFIVEFARSARSTIALAPCCSPRMTADEAALVDHVVNACLDPALAQKGLADLAGGGDIRCALSAAMALSAALAEHDVALGRAC